MFITITDTNWGSVNDTATCGNSTHGFCTICDESNQSPINIVTSTASDADYSDFSFSLGYQVVQEGTIKSNGHTSKSFRYKSYRTLWNHKK